MELVDGAPDRRLLPGGAGIAAGRRARALPRRLRRGPARPPQTRRPSRPEAVERARGDGTACRSSSTSASPGSSSRRGGAERTATELRALTPAYASPEQIRGDAVTTATDVYSLGALLYILLTGRPPHPTPGGGDVAAVLNAVLTEEPSDPRRAAPDAKVPRDLDAIVLKALRKEPEARYGSVDQLAAGHRAFPRGPAGRRAARHGHVPRAQVRPPPLGGARRATGLVAASLVGGLIRRESQRRKAERRFEDVRKLARTVMFDLHDSIARLPGSTKAREALVKTGLEYADALAREASSDPDLQREVAAAYSRLGDVQGGSNSNLGDKNGAKASVQKAVAIREALVASRFATDRDRILLATTLVQLSSISGPEARGGLQKAQEILEAVLRSDPRSFEARHGLAVTHRRSRTSTARTRRRLSRSGASPIVSSRSSPARSPTTAKPRGISP